MGKVYELVGVRNDDTGVTLFGVKREEVTYSSTLQVGTQLFQQTSRNSVIHSSPRSKNDKSQCVFIPYASREPTILLE